MEKLLIEKMKPDKYYYRYLGKKKIFDLKTNYFEKNNDTSDGNNFVNVISM